MPDLGEPIIQLRDISKEYRALRPLRVRELDLCRGQSIALLGLDAMAAEVLVSVITGATLPDTGEARVLGQPTSAITSGAEWLKSLEQFGLLSERSILIDQLTAEQNLALPFSLEVEDMSPSIRARVRALASELGLREEELTAPSVQLSPAARLRVRLGRALALEPPIFLAEHPNAGLPPDDTPAFAADLARIIMGRKLASLVITADQTFASAVADHVFTLQPASGVLKRSDGWRRPWYRWS